MGKESANSGSGNERQIRVRTHFPAKSASPGDVQLQLGSRVMLKIPWEGFVSGFARARLFVVVIRFLTVGVRSGHQTDRVSYSY